jgi:hypothetical protein
MPSPRRAHEGWGPAQLTADRKGRFRTLRCTRRFLAAFRTDALLE